MGVYRRWCGPEQLSSLSSSCAGKWRCLTQGGRVGMSKNLWQRGQADTDSWNGLFDTSARPSAVAHKVLST
jgi:hypothetical protein